MCFVRDTVKADGFAYVSRYAKEAAEAYFGIAHRKNSALRNPINASVFNMEVLLSAEDKRLFRERLGMYGFGGMCLNVSLDEPRMLCALSIVTPICFFPSWVEGFGLPPMEAIACGTPAVCADTSGLHENLEGVCPRSSPPDHVDGYLAVLDAALCGEQKLDEEKVQALLARFSMKAIAERLTAFFYSLLDR